MRFPCGRHLNRGSTRRAGRYSASISARARAAERRRLQAVGRAGRARPRPAARALRIVEMAEGDRFDRPSCPRAARSHSLRWRSPTMRVSTTSNSPSNSGSGKFWPQGPPAASARAVSSEISEASSSPSVSSTPCIWSGDNSRPTSSANASREASRGCAVEASAPPPSRGRRSARSDPGGAWRSPPARRARARPATERAEPRSSSSPAGANATTGRCSRSFMREATRPTMPACQPASNSARPGGRLPSRDPQASHGMRAPRRACALPARGARGSGGRAASASASASDGIVRQQAADADRHVVDAARRRSAAARSGGRVGAPTARRGGSPRRARAP